MRSRKDPVGCSRRKLRSWKGWPGVERGTSETPGFPSQAQSNPGHPFQMQQSCNNLLPHPSCQGKFPRETVPVTEMTASVIIFNDFAKVPGVEILATNYRFSSPDANPGSQFALGLSVRLRYFTRHDTVNTALSVRSFSCNRWKNTHRFRFDRCCRVV